MVCSSHKWTCTCSVGVIWEYTYTYKLITLRLPRLPATARSHPLYAYLYLSLVWEGRSRLEYCLDRADKSPSPFPRPPRAGSNVGRAAVVILCFLCRLDLLLKRPYRCTRTTRQRSRSRTRNDKPFVRLHSSSDYLDIVLRLKQSGNVAKHVSRAHLFRALRPSLVLRSLADESFSD